MATITLHAERYIASANEKTGYKFERNQGVVYVGV